MSTATVSRVINNFSYVSPENRERVLDAVRRHNYYPSAHARSLASGRSNLIGLVISDIANPFFPELVKGIEAAAYEQGYEVILADTNYDPRRLSNYVRRFIERGVHGVALMVSEFNSALLDELARCEVSVVFLDLGKPGPHLSNLTVNYQDGIEQAVAHLVQLGHTRIAYVGGPTELRSARRRETAFVRSYKKFLGKDHEPSSRYEGDFRIEGGRKAGEALIADPRRYTAVMVANDMMALGVVRAARAAKISHSRGAVDRRLRRHRAGRARRTAAHDRLDSARSARPQGARRAAGDDQSSRAAGRGDRDSHVAGDSRVHRTRVRRAPPRAGRPLPRQTSAPDTGTPAAPTPSCRSSRARAPARTSRRR